MLIKHGTPERKGSREMRYIAEVRDSCPEGHFMGLQSYVIESESELIEFVKRHKSCPYSIVTVKVDMGSIIQDKETN